jgi:basic membrane protein A
MTALLVALALFGASCNEDNGNRSGADHRGAVACEVTDQPRRGDALNAMVHAGVMRAEQELEVTTRAVQSVTPDIESLLRQGCDIIISVGLPLAETVLASADSNPQSEFAIVDFWFDFQIAEELTRPNVRLVVFRSDQASFLAGYLAAGMTKTGKIATFGGENLPTERTVMDGFLAGARAYKQDNNAAIRVFGWNGTRGVFIGDSDSKRKSRVATKRMIAKGADIVLPVVGAGTLGAAEAARDEGDVLLIGTDADQAVFAEAYADLWLTSVEKNPAAAVFDVIASEADGSFEGGLYVGTLENGGVSLAPYHRLSGRVPPTLKRKLSELHDGIIDGWVSVEPDDYVPYNPHMKHGHHDPAS